MTAYEKILTHTGIIPSQVSTEKFVNNVVKYLESGNFIGPTEVIFSSLDENSLSLFKELSVDVKKNMPH